MIKITAKMLIKLKACKEGIDWFTNQKETKIRNIVEALIKDNHSDYAKWLLKTLLTKEQNVLWAINSAELVLGLFESKYTKDDRPRNAILAAKAVINKEIVVNAAYAADAADAANAAHAAAYAADAACAANAAYAAACAANAAYAANKEEWQMKIYNFALILLGQ